MRNTDEIDIVVDLLIKTLQLNVQLEEFHWAKKKQAMKKKPTKIEILVTWIKNHLIFLKIKH